MLAHHLGRALQLTNILRDLDEDAAIGRLYLPREHLKAAGILADDPLAALAASGIDTACRETARIAHDHYRQAEEIMRAKPKGRIRTPRLMAAVYAEILRRMEEQGWAAPRNRISLPKSQLLMILLRHGIAG